jgi:hypothetical protein
MPAKKKGISRIGNVFPRSKLAMAKTRVLTARRQGPTGPRTPAGKQRSRLNALKHGLFAEAVILEGESREDFELLHCQLAETLQPVGSLEQMLVEKLAVTTWRYRRFLKAESAEITRTGMQLDSTDGDGVRTLMLARSLWQDTGSIQKAFLMHKEEDLLARAKELEQLRERILTDGLDWKRDREVLIEFYGGSIQESEPANGQATLEEEDDNGARAGAESSLVAEYRELAQQTSDADQHSKSRAAREMTEKLTQQIEAMKSIGMRAHWRNEKMRDLRGRAGLIPEERSSDRFLRYEAALERIFDRTLTQLERLQRMRLGQPTIPPVKVEVAQ